MERLVNKKVYVGEYSKEVQKIAFKLGFFWSKGKVVDYITESFLFFYSDGHITCSSSIVDFNNSDFEEIGVGTILSLQLKDSIKWESKKMLRGYFISENSVIKHYEANHRSKEKKNVFQTKEQATAALALSQLSQWLYEYNDGWTPNWEDEFVKYTIVTKKGDVLLSETYNNVTFLAFHSEEVRNKFYSDFRNLIERAKMFL